jgi:hypothetical protein
MLGGYAEVSGGHSDPECTHVILKAAEYDKILDEKRAAERETAVTRADGERVLRETESRLWQVQEESRKAAEAVAMELESAKQEAAYQRRLNENLLRISRERANADRALKPKKEHSGYVVVMSSEKKYRYKLDRRRTGLATLWETIIQTPYSVEFTEEQVKAQIKEELFPQGGQWLMGKIGINGRYNGDYEDLVHDEKMGPDFLERNIVLSGQQGLMRNFKTGYWDIKLTHTRSLGQVPAEMRARTVNEQKMKAERSRQRDGAGG